tara:strand:- start:4673 stop:6886 length:2214 start_codon:yes stop_codon:yes gene_type:complete
MLDAIDPRYVTGPTGFKADVFPATGRDLRRSSDHMTDLNFLSDSSQYAMRESINQNMDTLFDTPEGATKARQQAPTVFASNADELDGRQVYTDNEANYVAMARALRAEGKEPPTYDELRGMSAEMARMSKAEFYKAEMYNVARSPKWSAFLGGAAATMTDPLVMASVALSVPIAAAAVPGRVALAEGVIGLATELPIQAKVMAWQKEIGDEYTAQDAILATMAGTFIPAGLGAGASALYRRMGGTNKTLFTGPPAYERSVVRTAGRKPYTLKTPEMDRIYSNPKNRFLQIKGKEIKKPHFKIDPMQSSTFSWTEPLPNAGPSYQPLAHQAIMTEVVNDLPSGSAYRYEGLTQARNQHLVDNNPAGGQGLDAFGKSPDSASWMYNRPQMDSLHQQNLQQALDATYHDAPIKPVNTTSLSAELFGTASDVNHIITARKLAADGVKVDMKSVKYRRALLELVRRAATAKLQEQSRAAVLPPAPPVTAPRVDVDTLVKRQQDTLAQIEEVQADLTRLKEHQRKLGRDWEARQRVDADDEGLIPKPDFATTPERMNKAVTAAQTRLKNLTAKVDTYEEAVKKHSVAAASKLQREKIANAQSAQRQLDTLNNNKLPPELKDMQTKFHDSLEGITKDEKYMDTSVVGKDIGEQWYRSAPLSSDWDKGRNVKLSVKEQVKLVEAGESPAVAKALEADMERLPDDFTFQLEDGTTMTAKQTMDEIAASEDVVEALRTCSLPGGGAA